MRSPPLCVFRAAPAARPGATPLRLHHRSDIPEIARHFVKRAAEYFGKPLPTIEPDGLERLNRYDWPGNMRELRNVIERSMIFSRGALLHVAELSPTAAAPAPLPADVVAVPRGITLDEVERLYIEETLRDAGRSTTLAAERLGISRKVLWQRRKRHGLSGEATA